MLLTGHRVFGIPLTESIRYAHSSISYVDASSGMSCYGIIPTVVAKCGAFLKEQGRLMRMVVVDIMQWEIVTTHFNRIDGGRCFPYLWQQQADWNVANSV